MLTSRTLKFLDQIPEQQPPELKILGEVMKVMGNQLLVDEVD